jgi:hypothetical protein
MANVKVDRGRMMCSALPAYSRRLVVHALGEVGRDFPVVEPFDGERHPGLLLRGRGDRIAALGLVAIFGRQAHIDVLPRAMPRPGGEQQREARGPRRFDLPGHHFTQLPAQSPQ